MGLRQGGCLRAARVLGLQMQIFAHAGSQQRLKVNAHQARMLDVARRQLPELLLPVLPLPVVLLGSAQWQEQTWVPLQLLHAQLCLG